jgi:hypothetical protein
MSEEVWRTYPEFSFIEGSNLGNVRTIGHYVTHWRGGKRFVEGSILTQHLDKNSYLFVCTSVNGRTINRKVHRIVASCFIPNPYELPQVNHKNCNRTDNRVENLEWCSASYNCQYREKHGKAVHEKNALKLLTIVVNLKTYDVLRFNSRAEASRSLTVDRRSVFKVLAGEQKQASGYWFTNADSNAVENVRVKFGDVVADKVAELVS